MGKKDLAVKVSLAVKGSFVPMIMYTAMSEGLTRLQSPRLRRC